MVVKEAGRAAIPVSWCASGDAARAPSVSSPRRTPVGVANGETDISLPRSQGFREETH